MEYSEQDVIDIIKTHSKKLNAKKMIENWKEKLANSAIDSKAQEDYSTFVFTFPVIIDDNHVADITIIDLHTYGLESEWGKLIAKYLGAKDHEKSWKGFSFDTYLHAFLTIKGKELALPKSDFSDDFFCYADTFKDINGKEIKYTIAFGDLGSNPRGNEIEKASEFIDNKEYYNYFFDDVIVTLQIEKIEFEGNSLGEEINKKIKERTK